VTITISGLNAILETAFAEGFAPNRVSIGRNAEIITNSAYDAAEVVAILARLVGTKQRRTARRPLPWDYFPSTQIAFLVAPNCRPRPAGPLELTAADRVGPKGQAMNSSPGDPLPRSAVVNAQGTT
jgi:hypothetical protein